MTAGVETAVRVRHDRRERRLPGGLGRGTFFVGASPPRLVSGCGYRVVDEAGRELIDFNNNFTALLHGHAHPDLTRAAVDAVRRGACFGLPNAAELMLADEVVDRVPWAEQVRFVSSGTEATMSAVRIARAVTGRDVVVMLAPAYHGTGDSVLPASSATRGIPSGTLADSPTVPPNDLEALRVVSERHGDDLAAVILDLAPALAGCVPLEDNYVSAAVDVARSNGALVLIDEVISFRHAFEGFAYGRYRLAPDLLVLGKVIGGGFPIGAVLGREHTMSVLDPSQPDALLHGGTFSGNPVTMSAGAASLRLYDRPVVDRLTALGDHARARFGEIAQRYGWTVSGVGSVFRLAPAEPEAPARRHELWWKAYANGLLLSSSGVLCVSTPMDQAVIEEAASRLQASFADMAERQ